MRGFNVEETGSSAEEIQKTLLEEAGVAAIAGAAFVRKAKNFLRFSLVSARNLLEEALTESSAFPRNGARR